DRWLKDAPTGIEETATPLHAYDIRAKRWVDSARYPFEEASPQTFYLGGGPSGSSAPSANDGQLTGAAPKAAAGAAPGAFVPATSPCTRQTSQWSMGGGPLV